MAEPYMGEWPARPGEMRAAGHNGQVPGGGAEEANDGRSDTSTPAIRAALVNGEWGGMRGVDGCAAGGPSQTKRAGCRPSRGIVRSKLRPVRRKLTKLALAVACCCISNRPISQIWRSRHATHIFRHVSVLPLSATVSSGASTPIAESDRIKATVPMKLKP